MSIQEVKIKQQDHILRIEINRPQKKNALTPSMYDALSKALLLADKDPAIHVVYLTGSGDSYSAGNDLKTFRQNPDNLSAHHFITTISKTRTPLVAAVNGIAVGVGVTMLMHCDLVYASNLASFNFAFIDLGLVPEAASSYLLPRLIGQRRSAELLLLGGKFGAQTAREAGIINEVVADGELEAWAWGKAEQLAAKPPEAVQQSKALLKRGTATAIAETIDAESQAFRDRLYSDEVKAILASMSQGR